jgi:hypothetical protein
MVETFIDAPIPKFCGQLGFKLNEEQSFNIGVKDYDTARYYTSAQCEKLGGQVAPSNHCLKRDKKGNVQADYSVLCGGLNKKSTSPPEECGTYGTPFMATKKQNMPNWPECIGKLCGKDVSMLNNHLRSYTKEECTALNRTFIDSGYGLGQCSKINDMDYTVACASLNSSTLPSMSSITNAGSSWFSKKESSESGDAESDRTWWAYFFGTSKQDDSATKDKEGSTKE